MAFFSVLNELTFTQVRLIRFSETCVSDVDGIPPALSLTVVGDFRGDVVKRSRAEVLSSDFVVNFPFFLSAAD